MEHFLEGFVLLRHWYINIHKFSLLKRLNGALPSWKCSIKATCKLQTSVSHGVIFFLLKLNDYFLILRWIYIVHTHHPDSWLYYVKITQIQQVFSMFVCNIKQANIYDAPQTIQRDWHLWCIYDVGVDLSPLWSICR